ncbi:unnamed protein product [Adineta steineri]|uniref:t-SNARE coiled-coil homology domain-containing protein n=3 Tax=Adineta steineri TaxID=433720 RepID=A0A814M1B2_9BILA|nr:unnamed protein product [Adineta steineri]CAF1201622.1 unnamed protein product [Adineta steineri]CAF3670151.1 unnamed protein product [Adineta steineri]CAF3753093.1 unnamed protein product [Adineta steineri]
MQPSNNNDEFNAIQAQINQKTNESLESTRRMLGLASETQEVGINTMIMLDEQGEKLNKIEEGLDNIDYGMDEAERNLNNLEKCCGLCVLPWKRVRRTHRPFTNSSTTISSDTSSPKTTEPKLRMAGEEGMPSKGYITRITNDDREEEMDDNLQLVGSFIGNLKNMALDMGDTITNQSKQIDAISKKAESGSERVEAANKRTNILLRK